MAKLGHLYIWFVIVVAAVAGLPRLLLSRRFAELQQTKLKQRKSVVRSRNMSIMILVLVAIFASLYFTPWGHQAWIAIAIIFSLLSAAEFFFQSQFSSLEALIFQNRLLGILYVGLSIGSYLMLSRV